MIVDRYEPINLFALIPQRYATFEPQLHHLDHLLGDRVEAPMMVRREEVL